jgi:hypothetical protein
MTSSKDRRRLSVWMCKVFRAPVISIVSSYIDYRLYCTGNVCFLFAKCPYFFLQCVVLDMQQIYSISIDWAVVCDLFLRQDVQFYFSKTWKIRKTCKLSEIGLNVSSYIWQTIFAWLSWTNGTDDDDPAGALNGLGVFWDATHCRFIAFVSRKMNWESQIYFSFDQAAVSETSTRPPLMKALKAQGWPTRNFRDRWATRDTLAALTISALRAHSCATFRKTQDFDKFCLPLILDPIMLTRRGRIFR